MGQGHPASLYGGGNRARHQHAFIPRSSIRIKVLDQGKWLEPKADFAASLPADMREYNELPQLQPDSDGRMWLAFRHRVCRNARTRGWAGVRRSRALGYLRQRAFLGNRWTVR